MAEYPLVDLKAQFAAIEADVREAIERVIVSQVFVNGPETKAFEEEFAAFSGVEHVVAVSNGTTALELALEAVGVGQDDEVITVSHTFFATTGAIARRRAVPVFVDVDPSDCTMAPQLVAAAVTPRTAAIVPVHLYGHPADVPAIAAAAPGIPIVEDAAQAHGARYEDEPVGSLAAAATFSFFPGKNLGAYGDAGAVVSNDPEIARRVRALRNHGRSAKYEHDMLGTNARAAELQAAVLRAKLPYLADWTDARRVLAGRYEARLAPLDIPFQLTRPWATHARHLFVVMHPARDLLLERLRSRGIEAGVHFPVPSHLQAAMAGCDWRASGVLAATEELARTVLSLPLYAELGNEGVDRICDVLESILADLSEATAARSPA